jgi:hypothetical protein
MNKFKPGMILFNTSLDFVIADIEISYYRAHEWFRTLKPFLHKNKDVLKHPKIDLYTNIFIESDDI